MRTLVAYQREVAAARLTKHVRDSDRDGQKRCFGQGSNFAKSVEAACGRKARGTDQNACRQSSLQTALLPLAPDITLCFYS